MGKGGVGEGLGMVHKKKKDISTMYTKYENISCGRKGYYLYKRAKVDVISPKDYGMYLQKEPKR